MRKNLLIASSASASERNKGELVNLFLRGAEKDDIEEKAKFYDYIEILRSDKKNKDILDKIDTIEDRYSLIMKENHAYEISMLDITGKDLMDIGISKGPKIGEVLEFLLKKVIENPLNNEKLSLLRLAKEFK